MDTNNDIILGLSKTLFWDVDIASIDYHKHAPYIIERVLNRGTMEDWNIIKTYYGKPKIKETAMNLRYMDNRLLHFCSAYFDVPIKDFRCYTQRQSSPSHWQY